MSSIQQKKLPEQELQRLGVDAVYLFGSQAEGVAGEASDIDVGILLKTPIPKPESVTSIYHALFNILSDSFDMSNFRTIDIVFLDRAPLELCFDVIQHGIVLYESSQTIRTEFEERVAALYRDFQPILKQFNEAVLEKI
ncbi:MAG: hypothetical protein A3D50_02200 [Candidatus Taylorbacteria bacterium RIFCSPHIGHO2_02_FULL_44_12]|uniref:Polymerase beta nucleotidyltransferase domain-containing protein n=1 Tax=Candidatus Taylorbacteria bacterium RIFCSPHIGHO2_02_FULL_44_12 TaxID=1802308 RepID=A0A1G2MMR2_9BACT|nr:MAG: hypothetical protein A3D50_02200 [Candidatus Taylorbacteria bacterium RIFCSPHIGHO2_02_FULL_44_12]